MGVCHGTFGTNYFELFVAKVCDYFDVPAERCKQLVGPIQLWLIDRWGQAAWGDTARWGCLDTRSAQRLRVWTMRAYIVRPYHAILNVGGGGVCGDGRHAGPFGPLGDVGYIRWLSGAVGNVGTVGMLVVVRAVGTNPTTWEHDRQPEVKSCWMYSDLQAV